MAVGTTAMTCYQKEDVIWDFTVSDPNVSTITGWTISLKIKASPAAADPALLGPFTCTVTGTLVCRASFKMDIAPGSYYYGVRRTDTGTDWQLAQATVTVLDSVNVDP